MPKKNPIALAVDLGGTNLRVALVHESGKIEASLQTETHNKSAPEDICKQIAQLCNQLLRQQSHSYAKIEGIGVSLPGFLLKQSETIHFSPNLPQFRNFPVGACLRNMLDAPL